MGDLNTRPCAGEQESPGEEAKPAHSGGSLMPVGDQGRFTEVPSELGMHQPEMRGRGCL